MERMTRRVLLATAAAAAPGLFACGGDDSAGPTAPPAPPLPPPPAFTVSFAENELEIREGETLSVTVTYEVRELAAPLQVRLGASHESASEADYELSEESVEIPAGQDLVGETTVTLSALGDLLFTEGAETLPLAFVPPAEQATLGDPVEITIVEMGASPCPGISVIGLPWREEESSDEDSPRMLATTLSIELGAGTAGTRLEVLGPYFDLGTYGRIAESVSAFGINRWSLHAEAGSIVHELDVNWSGEDWFEEEAEASLDLAFAGGACSGEPVASCTSEGCEIIP